MSTIKDSILNAVRSEIDSNPAAAEAPKQAKQAKEFNYLDIKKSSSWSISNNVFQWNCRQFALYILNSYKKKFNEDWDVKLLGVITHINGIKQSVFDVHGFCDNVVLKDYIDYYFNNWADFYKSNDNDKFLNFMTLKFKRSIEDFSSNYNYSNRLKFYQKYNGLPSFESRVMRKQFKEDITEFVKSYGFIIAVNFLLAEGYNNKEALKKVGAVMLSLYKEDRTAFNDMMMRVEEFSPYPKEFKFNKENKFLKLIFKDKDVLPVSVKYSFDAIEWEFLKGD